MQWRRGLLAKAGVAMWDTAAHYAQLRSKHASATYTFSSGVVVS
jgi:hypothetical protein